MKAKIESYSSAAWISQPSCTETDATDFSLQDNVMAIKRLRDIHTATKEYTIRSILLLRPIAHCSSEYAVCTSN